MAMPIVAERPDICMEGGYGFVIPHTDTEWEWNDNIRALLYGLALAYFFLGVSIVADIFMGAIENITSRRRQRTLSTGQIVTVKIWNDTVANLTLMALGSSAPEILLAVTELLTGDMYSGELGPATIVGSASFNLFMIIAVCIFVIPSTETRKVQEVPVFLITAVFMFIAYGWLVVIVEISSKEIVEIWEAIATLLMLPVLVTLSYLADVGFFGDFGKAMEVRTEDVDRISFLLNEYDRETIDAIRAGLAEKPAVLELIDAPSASDMQELRKMVKRHIVTKKSRAARRVEATRVMTGGKRIEWEQKPIFENSARVSGITGACLQDIPLALAKGTGPCVVQFAAETQCLSEDVHEKHILIMRSGDCSEAITVTYGVAGPNSLQNDPNNPRRKSLETLPAVNNVASMKAKTDMRISQCGQINSVLFNAGEEVAQIDIISPLGVTAAGENNEFAVVLLTVANSDGEETKVHFGTITTTLVVMCNAGSLGRLAYAYERLLIQGSPETQTMQILVQRVDGCGGRVSCAFRTERLGAVPGYDFEHAEGTVEFEDGVTEAFIELQILPKRRANGAKDDFLLVLEDPDGADFNPVSDGGLDSEILTIEIGPRDLMQQNFSVKMMRWFDGGVNFDEVRLGNEEYMEQFKGAIFCNGSYEEQQDASRTDWIFHLIALPWKLVFMFVPPVTYCGGWICFYMSLWFIAGMTAFIGDLAELFGCVVGVPDLLTAISFVALGTSMPDLFASLAAARQDPTADAAIVNVTGSNCVNVFLGLGLPWTAGAIYWKVKAWDPMWLARISTGYSHIADQVSTLQPNGSRIQNDGASMVFVVRSGDLVFSVCVFSVCACVAVSVLMIRRRKIGAELGGPFNLKCASSVCMSTLWIVYLGLSGWWSLRSTKADTNEKTIVIVLGVVLVAVTFAVFAVLAWRQLPPKVTHVGFDAETRESHTGMNHRQQRSSKDDDCHDVKVITARADQDGNARVDSKESGQSALSQTSSERRRNRMNERSASKESAERRAMEEAAKQKAQAIEELQKAVVDVTVTVETVEDLGLVRTPPKTPQNTEEILVASESASPPKDERRTDPIAIPVEAAVYTEDLPTPCCMTCCMNPSSTTSNGTPVVLAYID